MSEHHTDMRVVVVRTDPRRLSARHGSALRHGQHHLGRIGIARRVQDGMVLVHLAPTMRHDFVREWFFVRELQVVS